jgi:ankyrin repeat protein
MILKMAKPGKPNKSEIRVDTLSFDIRDGNNENVKTVLFEVGIDALDGYQRTSLIWASFYNNTELLKWLIDNGADINHQERNGFSALHFAGKEQHYYTAAILIENKADLEIKDSKGNTPLMDAIFNSNGDYKIVDLLIVSGANLDNVNNHEMTPKLLDESLAGFNYNLPTT